MFIIVIIHFMYRGWHGIVEVTNKLVALYLKILTKLMQYDKKYT